MRTVCLSGFAVAFFVLFVGCHTVDTNGEILPYPDKNHEKQNLSSNPGKDSLNDMSKPDTFHTTYLPERFTGFVSDARGLVNTQNGLIYFNLPANTNAEIGDRVLLTYSIVFESYPGQATADTAEIISPPKEENQSYSEKEAIQLAFEEIDLDSSTSISPIMDYIYVERTDYNGDEDKWTISMNVHNEMMFIEIEKASH
ncbi:hypothetical protein [Bacillus sp. JCM 19041]|uniref:hypothetical protein n=1 Tax=Bacillus sp. JCM 19041 TaxID=1460637 RepID=UPI0006D17819